AGVGWQTALERALDFLSNAEWDAAVKWIETHDGTDNYSFSKQAINAYVAHEAYRFLQRGIRINAILPGPTNTPLAQANAEMWLGFGSDYREETGIEAATPLEQAYPLVFLCSDAAAGVSAITMITDAGYDSSGNSGSFPSES